MPDSAADIYVPPAPLGEQDLSRGDPNRGVLCPFGALNPQGSREWCKVWKNMDDFNDWGSEGNFLVCHQLCGDGRNPEYARRTREIRDRYAGQMPAWFRQMNGNDPVPRIARPVRGRRVR